MSSLIKIIVQTNPYLEREYTQNTSKKQDSDQIRHLTVCMVPDTGNHQFLSIENIRQTHSMTQTIYCLE
jgi:hypothetical protein